MFRVFTIPVCSHRLSRAIHQHIFSSQAGAQFTCLHDPPHFTDILVLVSTKNCIFTSLFMFEFAYVWICLTPMLHSFAIFPSQCALIGSAEQPWIFTQNGRFHYLGVQKQSKFPFVCWQTFIFVWPSSGSTHQPPQMKWGHVFIPQQ